ncbi:MAG TPA: hypothetical protein VHO69_00220 [Phototrophicaceae bacterium]|nr:hypothetical protein [Phototrophicaceae bacterium]
MKKIRALLMTILALTWVSFVSGTTASGSPHHRLVSTPAGTPTIPGGVTDCQNHPTEIIAAGWERSYRAGCTDDSGQFAGGSEVLHLVEHQEKLYAAVGYWMDERNPFYGGEDPTTGWAQILRLDSPTAHWAVDLTMPRVLRPEILKSVTFTTDGTGKTLAEPVTLLLAAGFLDGGNNGVNLYTRDDTTGQWVTSTIVPPSVTQTEGSSSVRAMQVYQDKVTGIEHLFITIGMWGVFSGVYDPVAPGSIRWETVSETGLTTPRPLALIEANGALLVSVGKRIYQRLDGPAPRWKVIVDESDLLPGIVVVNAPAGGIRGLTAIPAPNGAGESLIFLWAPGSDPEHGTIMRLDPDGQGGYQQFHEVDTASLLSAYLGTEIVWPIGAYNDFLPVTDPTTGREVYLFGMQTAIPEKTALPNYGPGFYAGALYGIRDSAEQYRVREVNGKFPAGNPPLVSVRTYTLSPFPADQGQVIYFGGFDANYIPNSNTAWVFRTSLANALARSQ